MDQNQAMDRGWEIVTHEISAEKDAHVFKGRPEDVLARIERFEEHGDFVQAAAEAAERKAQQESINRLMRRLRTQAEEYLRESAPYRANRDSSDTRARAIAMRSLERGNEMLPKMIETLQQVLDHPREALLENEAFQAMRAALSAA
jgi:hypothetical protein